MNREGSKQATLIFEFTIIIVKHNLNLLVMRMIFLFLSMLWMFTGCTIEKRKHLSGYHVEWHKGGSNKKIEKVADYDLSENEEQYPVAAENVGGDTIPIKSLDTEALAIHDEQSDLSRTKENYNKSKENKIATKRYQSDNKLHQATSYIAEGSLVRDDVYQRTDPLAITAFVLAIVGYLVPNLFIGLLIIIAAFILGIVSLARIKKDPNSYKGKGLAVTAIVLGAIVFAIILAGMVALASL